MKNTTISLITVTLLVVVFIVCGCSGGGGSGDDSIVGSGEQDNGDTEFFSNGDVTLLVETLEAGNTRTAMVTDDNDNIVLSIEATTTEVTIVSPDSTTPVVITLTQPLTELPSAFELNRLAVFIAGQLFNGRAARTAREASDPNCDWLPDSFCTNYPGCDWIYDARCALGCCADHDRCFDVNNCNFESFFILGATLECRNCNDVVASCILQGCYYAGKIRDDDTCYDYKCSAYYDCDDGYCECTSPCDLEICDNDVDDDGDTLVDCDDPDCWSHAACIEICDNDIDDDGDTLVDCDDYDCNDDDACKCPLIAGICTTYDQSAGLSLKYLLFEPYPYTGAYAYCEGTSGDLWTAAPGGLTTAELEKKGTWDDNLKLWLGAEILTCGFGAPRVGNLLE